MTTDTLTADVERLSPQPGDLIVLRNAIPFDLVRAQEVARAARLLGGRYPDVLFLIVPGSLSIERFPVEWMEAHGWRRTAE